jgi:hypothetical protein
MSQSLHPENIKAHWEKFRPKMYRELQENGTLDQQAQNAANLTRDALGDLIEKGLPHNQAWELVRENWAFLPSEDQQPHLGETPPSSNPPITG